MVVAFDASYRDATELPLERRSCAEHMVEVQILISTPLQSDSLEVFVLLGIRKMFSVWITPA